MFQHIATFYHWVMFHDVISIYRTFISSVSKDDFASILCPLRGLLPEQPRIKCGVTYQIQLSPVKICDEDRLCLSGVTPLKGRRVRERKPLGFLSR